MEIIYDPFEKNLQELFQNVSIIANSDQFGVLWNVVYLTTENKQT